MNFRTYDVPNFQPAIYTASIRSPGLLGLQYASFTFPLSPQMIRKSYTALAQTYNTQGDARQNGVARIADQYGQTPPTYQIEGTTGWKRNSTNGYILTGLQSVQGLQRILVTYQSLNVKQVARGLSDLYTLEFYDYFSNDYWIIIPEGEQIFQQVADKPLYTYYRLRWTALRSVSAPILGTIDALANVFGTPATAAALNAASTVKGLLTLYAPSGELF